jgi:ADP-ribose pyrophosphatase YjhB (NUDIX family)
MKGERDDGILIGVGALVEDERGRILFVRHRPERGGFWQGKWILPGGMLTVGETIDEGIGREVAEETGLAVEIIESEIDPTERIVREEGRVTLHVVYIVKRARVIGGELTPASDVGEAIWVGRDEMAGIREEIHPDTVKILELFSISI